MNANSNANIELPDKLTFKRKEVEKITKLDGKVLDYWQKEFGGFSPATSQMGEVFYSRTDVVFILKLKHWMVVEKIDKTKIKRMLSKRDSQTIDLEDVSLGNKELPDREKLKIIRRNLQEILTILDKNDK